MAELGLLQRRFLLQLGPYVGIEVVVVARQRPSREAVQPVPPQDEISDDRCHRAQQLKRMSPLPQRILDVFQRGRQIAPLKSVGKLHEFLVPRPADQQLDVLRFDHRTFDVEGDLLQLGLQQPHVWATAILQDILCPSPHPFLEGPQRISDDARNVQILEARRDLSLDHQSPVGRRLQGQICLGARGQPVQQF